MGFVVYQIIYTGVISLCYIVSFFLCIPRMMETITQVNVRQIYRLNLFTFFLKDVKYTKVGLKLCGVNIYLLLKKGDPLKYIKIIIVIAVTTATATTTASTPHPPSLPITTQFIIVVYCKIFKRYIQNIHRLLFGTKDGFILFTTLFIIFPNNIALVTPTMNTSFVRIQHWLECIIMKSEIAMINIFGHRGMFWVTVI